MVSALLLSFFRLRSLKNGKCLCTQINHHLKTIDTTIAQFQRQLWTPESVGSFINYCLPMRHKIKLESNTCDDDVSVWRCCERRCHDTKSFSQRHILQAFRHHASLNNEKKLHCQQSFWQAVLMFHSTFQINFIIISWKLMLSSPPLCCCKLQLILSDKLRDSNQPRYERFFSVTFNHYRHSPVRNIHRARCCNVQFSCS